MSSTPPRVPFKAHLVGGWVRRWPGPWLRLAALESWALREEIEEVPVDRPVYVCGLARAGSTKLLECLAAHPDTASHRYRDFPPVLLPYWWSWLLDRIPRPAPEPAERAHEDGIAVTPESPEAFEEVVWMSFFPHLHDPERSAVLDAATEHAAFEDFYRDHVRKLLLVRGGRRYLAKGNPNVTRLAYLRKLFPDARFVVPVRRPREHVASLRKQHRLFTEAAAADPRVGTFLTRAGHYEFGPGRVPVHVGDPARQEAVLRAWEEGEEVLGWALQWDAVYRFLLDQLEADPELAAAVEVVRYEDLCAEPGDVLGRVFEHAALPDAVDLLEELAAGIRAPDYYRPEFSAGEEAALEEATAATAARLGYG